MNFLLDMMSAVLYFVRMPPKAATGYWFFTIARAEQENPRHDAGDLVFRGCDPLLKSP